MKLTLTPSPFIESLFNEKETGWDSVQLDPSLSSAAACQKQASWGSVPRS